MLERASSMVSSIKTTEVNLFSVFKWPTIVQQDPFEQADLSSNETETEEGYV